MAGDAPRIRAPWVAIPDLHGRHWPLDQAAQRWPSHHLLLLGDLLDRGNETPQLLELSRQLHSQGRLSVLWGNHEAFHIWARKGDEWAMNNRLMHGQATEESYMRQLGSKLARTRYIADLDWLEAQCAPWAWLQAPGGWLLAAHAWAPDPEVIRGSVKWTEPQSATGEAIPGWLAPHLWDRTDHAGRQPDWPKRAEEGAELYYIGQVHGHDPAPAGRWLPGPGPLGSWMLDSTEQASVQVLRSEGLTIKRDVLLRNLGRGGPGAVSPFKTFS